jgi:hypothetical protein
VSTTTSFQRVGTAGLAALAIVGLLAGCSSKKTAASTTGSTASTSPAAAAVTSAAAALPSETPTKVVATGGGKFCQQVADSLNKDNAADIAGGTDATTIKQDVQNEQALESQILKAAPNAIKPDLVTIFGTTDKLYAALAKANYDYSKLDPTSIGSLESPDVTAAEQHITSYMKDTCGIDIGGDDSSAAAEASAAEASALALLSAAAAPSS